MLAVLLMAAGAHRRTRMHGANAGALQPSASAYDAAPCKTWCGMPERPTPMKCGVFWFLHVPKTGGTTLMAYFKEQAAQRGWKYADMWQMHVSADEAQPGPIHWAAWNTSAKWQAVMAEVEKDSPRVLVHAHHNMPGLANKYFATQVLAPLGQRLASKGCELRFGTVLRDAVEHVKSAAFFGRVRNRKQMDRYGPRNSNPMTKYVVYNYQSQWPKGFKQYPSPPEVDKALLASAQKILSNFSLVGRTEDLDSFVRKLNVVLGWPEQQTADRENTTPSENHYELTTEEVSKLRAMNLLDNQLYKEFCEGGSASICSARAAQTVGSAPSFTNAVIDLPGQRFNRARI